MIIAVAFSVIGALLVLANSRQLRGKTGVIIAFILAISVSALGVYLILHASKDMDQQLLFPMFSPLTTLVLIVVTRIIYRLRKGMEIIFHIHGLIPARHEERYVTRLEKNITFTLLVFSVMIPYFLLMTFL